MFSRCKPEDERRKRVRKTDVAQKVLTITTSAASTIFLGLILMYLNVVTENQQILIINDEVTKEYLINSEKRTKETHKRHEAKIESIDNKLNNVDKRVYKLESYAN